MIKMRNLILLVFSLLGFFSVTSQAAETWQGLIVSAEFRCSPYQSEDYKHSQAVEDHIIRTMQNRIYSPYTGTYFSSKFETDIEHIVAKSEGHDSGMCQQSRQMRKTFGNDLLNLTLASPYVNRTLKKGKDAGEWLPDQNRCWFANRVIQVKRKYGLTVDRREQRALQKILEKCDSAEMKFTTFEIVPKTSLSTENADSNVLQMYDLNGNGRITCAEIRQKGLRLITRDHPAYVYMRDGDGDGVVCE